MNLNLKLIILLPAENFRHTSIGDLQYSRDITRSGTRMGQFDNFLSRGIRQRSSVDVNATQLIDTAVAGRRTTENRVLTHRGMMHQIFFWNKVSKLEISIQNNNKKD